VRVKVRYDTTLGIYGPVGTRTARLPKYVQRGEVRIWDYPSWWLKRYVCEIAKPLEWWRDE
jgi:hypothetical protein